MTIWVSNRVVDGARCQVVMSDEGERPDAPFELEVFSRDREFDPPGTSIRLYSSLADARQAAHDRYGVAPEDWKDAQKSPAREILENYASAKGLTVKLKRRGEEPDNSCYAEEQIVAELDFDDVLLQAADSVLVLEIPADSDIGVTILKEGRISSFSAEFPRTFHSGAYAERSMKPSADANYCFWSYSNHRAGLTQWYNGAGAEIDIQRFGLADDELIEVNLDDVTVTFNATRDIDDVLDFARKLAASLPEPKEDEIPPGAYEVDGLILDPQKLPGELRPLVPYIRKYSRGDDEQRSELLEAAPNSEKMRFWKAIEPLMPAIDDYLDSFGDDPEPEEAILVQNLALAADELFF